MDFEKNQVKSIDIPIKSTDSSQAQTISKRWKKIIVMASILGILVILAAIFIPLSIFVFFKKSNPVVANEARTSTPYVNLIALQQNQKLVYTANNTHQYLTSSKKKANLQFSNQTFEEKYTFDVNITVMNYMAKQLFITIYNIQNENPVNASSKLDANYQNMSNEIYEFVVTLNDTYGLQSVKGNMMQTQKALLKFFIGYIQLLIPSIDSTLFTTNSDLQNSNLILDIDNNEQPKIQTIHTQKSDNLGPRNVHQDSNISSNSSIMQLNTKYDHTDLLDPSHSAYNSLNHSKFKFAQSQFVDLHNKTLINSSIQHTYYFKNDNLTEVNNSKYVMNSVMNFTHEFHLVDNLLLNQTELQDIIYHVLTTNYNTFASNEKEIANLLFGNKKAFSNLQNNNSNRVLQSTWDDLLNDAENLFDSSTSSSSNYNGQLEQYNFFGYSESINLNYNGQKDSECAGVSSAIGILLNSDNIYNLNLDTNNPYSYSDSASVNYPFFDYEVPTPLWFDIELSMSAGGEIDYNLNVGDTSASISLNGNLDIQGSASVSFIASIGVYVEGVFLDTTLTFNLGFTESDGCQGDLNINFQEVPFELEIGIQWQYCSWCDSEVHHHQIWSDSFDSEDETLYSTTF